MIHVPDPGRKALLPEPLLRYAERDTEALPAWLTSRDEVWIRALAEAWDGFVGAPQSHLDAAFEARVLPRCKAIGAPTIAALGMKHVIDRFYPRAIKAAGRPCEVRQTLFGQAASGLAREEAIASTAGILAISCEDVLSSLFADRSGARVLDPAKDLPPPCELVGLYNLALLQGLLQRAVVLRVRAREHVRSVVRYAHLRGLICVCRADDEGTRIDLSGPMSLFRHTTRYGNALAAFVPALLSTPGWQIDARCVLRARSADRASPGDPAPTRKFLVRARAGDPLSRTHALPCETDSAVERRLMRDVRRLKSSWSLERETDAVRAGAIIIFPDFTLRRGASRVLVEIVGYYTPEYLQHKLRTLAAANLRNIVVCVDESLACEDGEIQAGEVLRYTKRVDAPALLAAAERVAARCEAVSSQPHLGTFRHPPASDSATGTVCTSNIDTF